MKSRRRMATSPAGSIELAQIPRHALLDLSKTVLHLRSGEILVAIVDSLDLAAVDRRTRRRQQTYRSAKRDELRADPLKIPR
jgi:hypothetical protein